MNADEALELKLELSFKVHASATKGAKAQPWFKDKSHLERVVDALADLPFFKDAKVAGPYEKVKPIKDVDSIKSLVANGRKGWLKVQSSDETYPDLDILFTPRDEYLEVTVRCARAVLEKHTGSLVEQFIKTTQAIREALGDGFGLAKGYVVPSYRISGTFAYPRPRPPRSHPGVPIHSAVDFIDLRFHESKHPDAEPDEAKALTASPLPPASRKSEKDGLVVIQWATSAEESELQRAASARALWFGANFPTEIDGGYNEQGDRAEDRGSVETKPPLTLYSKTYQTGYKAVVVFPDGSIEPEAWNQAKAVLKQKSLDDGSPVDAVKIVVPLRELVFTVSEEAKKEGFAAVLYPSDDGRFWNPDPPGMWLTGPLGTDDAKS